MAIYVDDVKIKWKNRVWCHLVADSLEELHSFANEIGLKRDWFQRNASYPHYDITLKTRSIALAKGATFGSRKTIIHCAKKLKEELDNKEHQENSIQLEMTI